MVNELLDEYLTWAGKNFDRISDELAALIERLKQAE
jgi:hypothetical protein